MRIQWEILLFIFILNLSVGLVVVLSFPGAAYVSPTTPSTIDAEDYENQFNATATAEAWSATPFSGIPVIGDIFGGFNFLWKMMGYLIDGFPVLLTWLSDSFIGDPSGQLAFSVIANALRGVYALLVSSFLIEFISGRIFTD